MADSGAQAALKGYRLQALYTLHRLLEASSGQIFHLEGHEDLDVLDPDGQLLEVIQLKAYDRNLTLSAFNPEKPNSFFKRVLARRTEVFPASESIVSFGPFGEEMSSAWNGDQQAQEAVIQKFIAWKYTAPEARRLLDSVTLHEVSESGLETKVMAALQTSVVGYDPHAAFALLHNLLYLVAEAHGQLTRQDLIDRLGAVARFLAEKASHHAEWFTTIIPLLDEAPGLDIAALRAEFDQGVSARYAHIQAGVDVDRPEIIQEIENAFSRSNTVIVRGASGQGKSTLAYRYLHDNVPETWRFEVRTLQDQRQALSVARALLGHLSAVGSVAYIYLDVLPGDTTWTTVVQDLQAHPNARLLVTIREEDWVRTAVGRVWNRPAEVELNFGVTEARTLYERLTVQRPLVHALDFDDLWDRFGGAGPLLEFTYLVTQDSTLETRLREQVNRLRDEVRRGERTAGELELLRRVAVASAYGARLDFPAVARAVALTEPRRTAELLEREYLLRTDAEGRVLDGLHPVRSVILSRLLTDDLFDPWGAVASRSLPQMLEQDWETFLLHAFSRHSAERPVLLRATFELCPTSWEGAALILRALLWLGVREYLEQNLDVITEVQSINGGWEAILMADVGQVDGVAPGLVQPFWEQLDFIPADRRASLTAFRARLTPNAEVLSRAQAWLTSLSGTLKAPRTSSGWSVVAELLYWSGRLRLQVPGVEALTGEFCSVAAELNIGAVADVSYACSFQENENPNLERLRPDWLLRFRQEAGGVILEDDGRRVAIHFLFPPDFIPEEPEQGDVSKNWIHEETLWRLDLLQRLRPGRAIYATQGYGHQIEIFGVSHDETRKEVPSRNLPPLWSTTLNGRYSNLGNYSGRPATWADFAERIWETRWSTVTSLMNLSSAIETFFRRKGTTPFLGTDGLLDLRAWNLTTDLLGRPPMLPQVAIDEWGFTAEGNAAPSKAASTEQAPANEAHSIDARRSTGVLALRRHRPYLDVSRPFFTGLYNFFRQAIPVLEFRPYTHRLHNPMVDVLVAQQMAERTLSERDVDGRLPTVNLFEAISVLPAFQEAFRTRYGSRWSALEIQALEKQEQQIYHRALILWTFFLRHTRRAGMAQPMKEAEREQAAALTRVKRRLRQELAALQPSGIRAQVSRISPDWEGKPALWIIFDIDDPVETYEAFERVMRALYTALPEGGENQKAQQFVELLWPTIHVVPTVRGKSLRPVSWRNTSAWLMQTPMEDLSRWNLTPQPLSAETWTELGLGEWSQPRLEWIVIWQEAFVHFILLLGHVDSLSNMPDPDEFGTQLLKTYAAKVGMLLSHQLQALIDASNRLGDYASGQLDTQGFLRPDLQEAINQFIQLWESMKDTGFIKDQQTWQLGEIASAYQSLQKLLNPVEHLRLLWCRDVLNHESNLGPI